MNISLPKMWIDSIVGEAVFCCFTGESNKCIDAEIEPIQKIYRSFRDFAFISAFKYAQYRDA